MKRQTYSGAVDKVLTPQGFTRSGEEWARKIDGYLDVVLLQRHFTRGVTANIRTVDLVTEAFLDEALPEGAGPRHWWYGFERIGFLMGGKDRWWRNEPNGPHELADAIRDHALPYFSRLRSLEAQAEDYESSPLGTAYSHRRMYRAVTLHRLGRHEEACSALRDLAPDTSPRHAAEFHALRERLGCRPT